MADVSPDSFSIIEKVWGLVSAGILGLSGWALGWTWRNSIKIAEQGRDLSGLEKQLTRIEGMITELNSNFIDLLKEDLDEAKARNRSRR